MSTDDPPRGREHPDFLSKWLERSLQQVREANGEEAATECERALRELETEHKPQSKARRSERIG